MYLQNRKMERGWIAIYVGYNVPHVFLLVASASVVIIYGRSLLSEYSKIFQNYSIAYKTSFMPQKIDFMCFPCSRQRKRGEVALY